jgi:hypothetical protein
MASLVLTFLPLLANLFMCGTPAPDERTAASECEGERVLFRKALEGGCELVVTRGPDRPISDLAALHQIASRPDQGLKCVFSVRAEFRAPGKSPVPLLSRLVFERFVNGEPGGFEILDILTGPQNFKFEKGTADKGIFENIVFAAAESGTIMLWELEPTTGALRIGYLPGSEWSPLAAARPIDSASVEVRLRRTADYLVEVKVRDLRSTSKQQTCFLEVANEWQLWRFRKLEGTFKGSGVSILPGATATSPAAR